MPLNIREFLLLDAGFLGRTEQGIVIRESGNSISLILDLRDQFRHLVGQPRPLRQLNDLPTVNRGLFLNKTFLLMQIRFWPKDWRSWIQNTGTGQPPVPEPASAVY
jgi:hypothetical protein